MRNGAAQCANTVHTNHRHGPRMAQVSRHWLSCRVRFVWRMQMRWGISYMSSLSMACQCSIRSIKECTLSPVLCVSVCARTNYCASHSSAVSCNTIRLPVALSEAFTSRPLHCITTPTVYTAHSGAVFCCRLTWSHFAY